jgi:UDP-N-acetylmuramoyl-L-alanyl-D-glutamate--2,6-diaminopimelate ligase
MRRADTPPRPRTAGALLRAIAPACPGAHLVHAARDAAIHGLCDDSREAEPGFVFFARKGSTADGRAFVRAAIERGAPLIVSSEVVGEDVPTLFVPDVDVALREAADAWYGRPQDALDLVGVTGTKGKTTTTYLVRAALAAAGRRTALLGTIAHDVGDGVARPSGNTTPGPLTLRRLLAEARDAGASACAMEVSSHALAQGRVEGLSFRAGVLTNFQSDHLDYHGTREAYLEAKALLFSGLSRSAAAVLNGDDPVAPEIARRCRGRVLHYGQHARCDVRASRVLLAADGTSFRLSIAGEGEVDVRTPLVGAHNVANFAAAVTAAHALGVDPVTAAEGAATLTGVRGRLERVEPAGDLHVFVDYAHTEEALRQVLTFLRTVGALPITCVFGCGGDRDRTKRPRMGRVGADLSDRLVITSDNPRTEDPAAILAEVASGVPADAAAKCSTVPDRREAIRRAVLEAAPGSTVLVAGKGHEDYQILGSVKVPFDDVAEAREALALRARGRARTPA